MKRIAKRAWKNKAKMVARQVEGDRHCNILASILIPQGWVKEHCISRVPGKHYRFRYRIDLAFVEEKIALEIDGPYHRTKARKERDHIKDAYLKSLGWRVIHVRHD
jgi:hypothetical protein